MNRIVITVFLCLLAGIEAKALRHWDELGPSDRFWPTYTQAPYLSVALDNNEPYIAFADPDHGGKVTVRKYLASSLNIWANIGNPGISAGAATAVNIAVDNNGVPYIAYRDAGISGKIVVQKYIASTWQYVGVAGFSANSVQEVSLVLNSQGEPYVAYKDGTTSKLIVQKFDGTSWVNIGIGGEASTGEASRTAIALDAASRPYVVFDDGAIGHRVSVRKFDGTNWGYVGPAGFSVGFIPLTTDIVVTSTGTPYITYHLSTGSSAVLYFDGANWVDAGSTGLGFSTVLALGPNDTVYNAYTTSGPNPKLNIKKYTGISWVNVGSTSYTQTDYLSVTVSNTGVPYVGFSDKVGRVLRFDGTEWKNVAGMGITESDVHASVATDKTGTPYILCGQTGTGKATVKKYVNNNWTDVGNTGFSNLPISKGAIWVSNKDIIYVAYKEGGERPKVQKFNGTTWEYVGDSIEIENAIEIDIATDTAGIPYVFYSDPSQSGAPTVKKFDGVHWVPVGNPGFDVTGLNSPRIAIDYNSTPYVSYTKNTGLGQAVVKKFDGSTWVAVDQPSAHTWPANTDIAIDSNNIPVIIVNEGFTQDTLSTKRYNGTTWARYNNPLLATTKDAAITTGAGGEVHIAYLDYATNEVWADTYDNYNSFDSYADSVSGAYCYSTGITSQANHTYLVYATPYGPYVRRLVDVGDYVENVKGSSAGYKIYPNPAHNSITIAFNAMSRQGTVAIINTSGIKMGEWELPAGKNTYTLPVQHLAPGVYFTTVATADGTVTVKFIKE